MDKREAIEYLEEKLAEIPVLARLRYNNAKYSVWINTIKVVVMQVFGRESDGYQKLATPYKIKGSYEEERQDSYKRNLQKQAKIINSIIQTWEKSGFETEIKGSSEPPEAFTAKPD